MENGVLGNALEGVPEESEEEEQPSNPNIESADNLDGQYISLSIFKSIQTVFSHAWRFNSIQKVLFATFVMLQSRNIITNVPRSFVFKLPFFLFQKCNFIYFYLKLKVRNWLEIYFKQNTSRWSQIRKCITT